MAASASNRTHGHHLIKGLAKEKKALQAVFKGAEIKKVKEF